MKYFKSKLFVLVCVLTVFVKVFSQNAEQNSGIPVDEITGLITYKDVVQTTGEKSELFVRAIGWVNSFYVNPADATKVRNPESGIIDILHRFRLTYQDDAGVQRDAGMVSYTLLLELRDGRYRYTLTNFTLRQASRFPVERWLDKTDRAYNPSWDDYLNQVDAFAKSLINSLKTTMEPEEVIKEEEW